jgi:endonuclease YncB( thermonuclease family)
LPLGNPRRIFVRQPRRTGVRITGMVLTACVATVLAAHPVFSALGQIMQGGGTPSALAADNVAVMDGQTLRVAGHVVRLDGVAAPARGAGCAAGADCAGRAALHLAALVQDQRVACQVIGADPAVARCQAGGREINQALVASGWAEARGNAPALRQAEDRARAQHLGLWAQRQ